MKKTDVDNVIFYSDKLDVRAGGPSGYLANLKNALPESENIKFIYDPRDIINNTHCKYILPKLLTFWMPIKKIRKKMRRFLIRSLYDIKNWDFDTYILEKLEKYNFKTVTCHNCFDVQYIKKYLVLNKSTAKIIQMSHSPEPPSYEIYHQESAEKNPDAEANFEKMKIYEKKSFEMADILLFPAEEAMESYIDTLEYFNDLLKQKDVRFLPTGCTAVDCSNVKENFREKYNIKTKYIIAYIGRHIPIKGYDILKSIAEKCLAARNDVTFLIGGNLSDEIPPLNHPNWIELGRINPADLLIVSDLFVLPNRQTYFDLILLEVLSAGVPIIASATGGNKSVFKMTNAIDLYTSEDECVNKIIAFLDSPDEDKLIKKAKARKAYEQHFSLKHFAENYINLINNICDNTGAQN